MKQSPPIFLSDNDVYKAGTCDLLEKAAAKGELAMHALSRNHYPDKQLPANTLCGLSSVGFWDATNDQSWGLPWHRNEGVEVCFLETGKLDFRIDQENNHYLLQPEDITITHPWQRHRIGNPCVGPSRLHWIIFDVNVRRPNQEWKWPDWIVLTKKDILDLTSFLRYSDIPVWQSTKQLRKCFSEIAHILESNQADEHFSMLTIKINELFSLLLDQFRIHKPKLQTSISRSQKTVEVFLNELETSLKTVAYSWSLKEMADQCELGMTQFRYYCKHLTNMSPMNYLAKCRVNWAVQIMREDQDISITQLALNCGFNSSQYFTKTFKKIKGVPPRKFLSCLTK